MTMSDRPRGGLLPKRWILAVAVVMLLASAAGWWALTRGRPWLDCVEGDVYGIPLVMMDLTKQAATSVPTAGEITAPVNHFAVMMHYPDASFRAIARTGAPTIGTC